MNTDHPSENVSCEVPSVKKQWVTPQVQDQTIKSLTEGGKVFSNIETAASFGPGS